jgi:CRISPR/Cas system CMR-associated protein Cmr1 (group 7 of RAMP superfamily)
MCQKDCHATSEKVTGGHAASPLFAGILTLGEEASNPKAIMLNGSSNNTKKGTLINDIKTNLLVSPA